MPITQSSFNFYFCKRIENSIKIVWHPCKLSGIFHTHKIPIKSGSSHKNKREREKLRLRDLQATMVLNPSCFLSQEKETNERSLQTSYKWSIILADIIKQTLISIIYLSKLNAYFWSRWWWNQYRQISIVCHFMTVQIAVENGGKFLN